MINHLFLWKERGSLLILSLTSSTDKCGAALVILAIALFSRSWFSLFRIIPQTASWYYTPTHGFNPGACLLLLALSLIFAVASIPLFVRRDIGGLVLPSWNRGKPEARSDAGLEALEPAKRNVFVRTVGLRALRAQLFSVCWWVVGLVIGVGWITML